MSESARLDSHQREGAVDRQRFTLGTTDVRSQARSSRRGTRLLLACVRALGSRCSQARRIHDLAEAFRVLPWDGQEFGGPAQHGHGGAKDVGAGGWPTAVVAVDGSNQRGARDQRVRTRQCQWSPRRQRISCSRPALFDVPSMRSIVSAKRHVMLRCQCVYITDRGIEELWS